MSRVTFITPLAVGTTLKVDGQLYTVAEIIPREGKPPMASWSSHCADCGRPFTELSGARVPETRRCKEHRKAGQRVLKVAAPASSITE
jgi:hypothetical protein